MDSLESLQARLRMREIEKLLALELHSAQEALRLANSEALELAALPTEDSRVVSAAARREHALDAFALAATRWNEFVLKALVPEDLETRDGFGPLAEPGL